MKHSSSKDAPKGPRKGYHPPQLRIYGDIRSLTSAGTNTVTDDAAMTGKLKS